MAWRMTIAQVIVAVCLCVGVGCGSTGSGDGGQGSSSGSLSDKCADACENIKTVCESSDSSSANPFTDVAGCTDACINDASGNAEQGAECLSSAAQCSDYATCYQEYYNGGGEGGDGLDEQDVTRAISPIDDAICERKYLDCCSVEESTLVIDDYKSVEGNKAAIIFRCQKQEGFPDYNAINRITRSINADRIAFDRDAISDCVTKAKSLSCSEIEIGRNFASFFDSCNVFSPNVDTGGDCLVDFDCRGGFCVGANPSEDTLGTCRKTGAVGESCEGSGYGTQFDCEEGLHCVDDTCEAQLQGGTECTFDSECVSGWCDDDTGNCRASTCNEK